MAARCSGPVWIQPGMADNTVGLALGYGREKTGPRRARRRFQCLQAPHQRRSVLRLGRATSRTPATPSYELATTQSHWSMEGRPVVREANLEQYRKNPDFAKG